MARDAPDPTRQELERDEDRRLAPYAMRSARARRRFPIDREGRAFDYRTEFQRDRDRILHARAFRRLRLKSHGGAIPPVERDRDRLTHTLEVGQLSRTVARGLGLNEDLVEAIALGHELGMPPFGRSGVAALAALLERTAGGFRYNEQSLRVVDRIEKRYEHAGLNLTDATREGIFKHAAWEPAAGRGAGARGDLEELHPDWAPFLEAQVVSVVDDLSGVIQDLDDGLRAGDLDLRSVEGLAIVRELLRRIGRRAGPAARRTGGRGELHMRANAINRGLTHMLVTGIIHESRRALRAWARARRVESHEAFLAARPGLPAGAIGLAPRARRLYEELRAFVVRGLHNGARLSGVAARARHVIGGLMGAITADPRLADDYLLLRFKQENGGPFLRDVAAPDMEREIARRYRGNARFTRLVVDHIAGMTDTFAISEHERLLGPLAMGGTSR